MTLRYRQIGITFLIIYIVMWGYTQVRIDWFENMGIDFFSATGTLILSASSQIVIRFLPVLVLCKVLKVDLVKIFRLKIPSLKQVGLSLVIYIVSLPITYFLNYLSNIIAYMTGNQYIMNNNLVATTLPTMLILVIAIGIIPPIFEELFFRGFLMASSEAHGPEFSILFAAFAFAITHDNPYRLLELFFFALIACMTVYYTGSIIPGMIIHILTNSSYVIISYIQSGDMVQNMADGTSSVAKFGERSLMLLIYLILSIIAYIILKKLYELLRRINKEEVEPLKLTKDIGKNISYMIDWPIILVIIVFILNFMFIGV